MFNLRIKTIQTKESYYEITLGVDARGDFLSRCSEKNWKNYRKTTAPKYLFNRAAGPQIFFTGDCFSNFLKRLMIFGPVKKSSENVHSSLKTKSKHQITELLEN